MPAETNKGHAPPCQHRPPPPSLDTTTTGRAAGVCPGVHPRFQEHIVYIACPRPRGEGSVSGWEWDGRPSAHECCHCLLASPSKTATCGGCPPPPLVWERARRARAVRIGEGYPSVVRGIWPFEETPGGLGTGVPWAGGGGGGSKGQAWTRHLAPAAPAFPRPSSPAQCICVFDRPANVPLALGSPPGALEFGVESGLTGSGLYCRVMPA